MIGRLAAWCGVTVMMLGACASDPDDARSGQPTATVAARSPLDTVIDRNVDAVGATIQQWREDEVRGSFQVQIDNDSSSDLDIASLEVRWAGFDAPTRTDDHALIVAGGRLDVTLPTVESRCDDPPGLDELPPATAAVAIVNGSYEIPITDSRGALARMYTASCRRQGVEARAVVEFGTEWAIVDVDGAPALRGDLRVEARGDSTVTLGAMDGSVLLSLEPVGGIEPVDGVIAVDVGRLGRCEPHALADSKHTYVFPLSLTIDGEPVDIDITPDASSQAQMLEIIQQRCGLD